MTNLLEITNIKINRFDDTIKKSTEKRAKITIFLSNTSNEKTVFFISYFTFLRYDNATGTLFIGLNVPKLTKNLIHFSMPRFSCLPPSKSTNIMMLIPIILKKAHYPSRPKENYDITNMKRVVCNISYNEYPFPNIPFKSPSNLYQELRRWAHNVEVSIDVQLSSGEKQDESDH